MVEYNLVSMFMNIDGGTVFVTTIILFLIYVIGGVSVFLYNANKEEADG